MHDDHQPKEDLGDVIAVLCALALIFGLILLARYGSPFTHHRLPIKHSQK